MTPPAPGIPLQRPASPALCAPAVAAGAAAMPAATGDAAPAHRGRLQVSGPDGGHRIQPEEQPRIVIDVIPGELSKCGSANP